MKNSNKDSKKIEKLEAKFEALLKHLKLEIFADENIDDDYIETAVIKRRKFPWE
jgi:hypothetical protein